MAIPIGIDGQLSLGLWAFLAIVKIALHVLDLRLSVRLLLECVSQAFSASANHDYLSM